MAQKQHASHHEPIVFWRRYQTTIEWLFRLLIAGILLFSAYPKLLDPQGFAINLSAYQLWGKQIIALLALYVPVLEFVVGISLLWNRLYPDALVGVMVLFFGFVFHIVWAMYMGLDLNCGCFGGDYSQVTNLPVLLVLDSFIIMVAMALFQSRKKKAG
jgi:uncharacterized membrane protein YphA (DoxX/SURF4 family)